MKRLLILAGAILSAMSMLAQTPTEIVSRMEEVIGQHQSEGIIMTLEMKIPGIEAVPSRVYMLGRKSCVHMPEDKSIIWTDETTMWNYDAQKNEVTISASNGNSQADATMFSDISKEYKIKLKNETADAWYFKCKRLKKNKEDSKKMDLVVAKETFYPISLSSKALIVKICFRDFAFGVTDDQVTFNPALYSTATITDKR